MKFTNAIILLAFVFIMTCAYGQDVHYDYARGTNFSAYRTYQWVDVPSAPTKIDLPKDLPDPPPGLPKLDFPSGGSMGDSRGGMSDDQLISQDIKRAVDEQLAQKGLTKVEENGDLQIAYHAAIREEKSIDLNGMGWGGRGYGWWDGSVQGQTSTIPIGTLVINVYDPARKQLIWRGQASKTIDLKKDPDKNYKNLQKAMTKLFKNYPPQAGK